MYARPPYGQSAAQSYDYNRPLYNTNDYSGLPPLGPSAQQGYAYQQTKPGAQQYEQMNVPRRMPTDGKVYDNPPDNRSFLQGLDNNSSGLLNQKKSYARNIQGRLLNQVDPDMQKAKDQKIKDYREQLRRQMEEQKQRKIAEENKIKQEEARREKKFYEEFQIKAQTKDAKADNQENGYFMARTNHKFKRAKIQAEPLSQPKKSLAPVIYARGKTYQNRSSLDNNGLIASRANKQVEQFEAEPIDALEANSHEQNNSKVSKLKQDLVRERSYQEQRISKLLIFQQRVLQKLNDIKVQIRNTSFDVDGQKELAKIRSSLRARRINIEDDFTLGDNRKGAVDSQFYSLPRREVRLPPRFSVKLKDISSSSDMRASRNRRENQEQSATNDKNISISHIEEKEAQDSGEAGQIYKE